MASELIQVIYHETQRPHCFPFARIHFNEGLTIFFENKIISELVMATDKEKISVCSWKLKQKLRYYIGQHREITQELLESDYDVMTFTRNTQHHRMLAAANTWHPGFLDIFDKILAAIGVTRPGEVKIPIYQNHHSSRTDIYQDYVRNYLNPAMEVMTNDKEINALAMRDSKYSDLTNQSGEMLQEKLGINYYPLAPFLLERLFSIYVHNRKIKVSYL